MLREKRGVSPLIATVLLIAFAVSLGAVIMNIGVNIGGNQCDDIHIEVFQINNQPRICFNQGTDEVRFTLNNIGERIDGIKVSAIGVAADSEEFIEPIEQQDKFVSSIKITPALAVDTVSIVPIVFDGNEKSFCAEQTINVANLGDC